MKIFIFLLSSLHYVALAHNEDSAAKLKARFSGGALAVNSWTLTDISVGVQRLDIMGYVLNRRKS